MSHLAQENTRAVYLTDHGAARSQQRGASKRLLALVIEHGDVALHAGDGCEMVGLSRSAANDLLHAGIPADDVRRAAKLKVVIADGSRAVTVLRDQPGKRGRTYRRQCRTFAGNGATARG